MLGSDNSVDPDDVRDELMTELVLLNGALKKLDPDVDFSEVLRPLLADTGPAMARAGNFRVDWLQFIVIPPAISEWIGFNSS